MTTKRIAIKLGELEPDIAGQLADLISEALGDPKADPAYEASCTLADAAKALRGCRTLLVDAACDADCGEDGDALKEFAMARDKAGSARSCVEIVLRDVDDLDSKDMLGDASWRLGVAADLADRARDAVAAGDGARAARIAGQATEAVLAACGLLTLAAVGL